MHLFDQAIALTPNDGDLFTGATNPAWGNFIGPFGGITAAVLLNAVMKHKALLGEPIAQTINYCTAVADGPFTIEAKPVRTNRSTQHWMLTMIQSEQVVMTGTVVTAARRETWSGQDATMPIANPPATYPLSKRAAPMRWLDRYEIRPIIGGIPTVMDESENDSLSQLWMKDADQRAVDMQSLAAFCDLFFPRLLLRRSKMVPFGTVSMTSYFHTDSDQLKECATADKYLLGQAKALAYRNGFFDQTAQVWSDSGILLASTHQVVYYKE
jgi:acyl-CoA thioesterase